MGGGGRDRSVPKLEAVQGCCQQKMVGFKKANMVSVPLITAGSEARMEK